MQRKSSPNAPFSIKPLQYILNQLKLLKLLPFISEKYIFSM